LNTIFEGRKGGEGGREGGRGGGEGWGAIYAQIKQV